MKRIFLQLSSIAISLSAFNSYADSWSCSDAFNGLYIGAGAGYTQIQADTFTDTSILFARPPGLNPRTPEINYNAKIYQNVAAYNLHLGFGHTLGQSPLYLALEVLGNNITEPDLNTQSNVNVQEVGNNTYTGKLTTLLQNNLQSAEFAIDLKPGILLSPVVLLYGRIGKSFNEIKLATNATFIVNLIPDPSMNQTFILATNNRENFEGYRLGGGLEAKLTPNWSIALDYIYTDYGKISTAGTKDTIDSPATTVFPQGFKTFATTDISSQTTLFDVNYYFNSDISSPYYSFNPKMINSFNGFYLGLNGGILQNQANTDIDVSSSYLFGGGGNIGTLQNQQNLVIKNSQGIIEGTLGYGFVIPFQPYLYLGADAFINEANRKYGALTNSADATPVVGGGRYSRYLISNTKLRLNNLEEGADLRPGIFITSHTLFYNRIGVCFNDVKLMSDNFFSIIRQNPGTATYNSRLLASETKNIVGLRIGGGIEEYLADNFTVNADYMFTYYGNISLNETAPVFAETGVFPNFVPTVLENGFVSNTKAKVQSQTVMLGINYHIN